MESENKKVKSWKDVDLKNQQKNALFELFSEYLKSNGEISIGLILNSCKNKEGLGSEMLKAVKKHQPVEEDLSGCSKLVLKK